jgi:hypothetical protein
MFVLVGEVQKVMMRVAPGDLPGPDEPATEGAVPSGASRA